MQQPSFSLSIPEPCTENWEQMTPCEKGRFCSNCQKTVVDFTGYTDAELVAFFSGTKSESVCGRFYTYQIENKVFSYTAPIKRPYRTLAMAASVAALTVLSFTADAQDTTRDVSIIPPVTVGVNTPTAENSTDTFTIEGIVKDDSGELILAASVQVFSNNRLIGGTATDLDGAYKITSPKDNVRSNSVSVVCAFGKIKRSFNLVLEEYPRYYTTVNFILPVQSLYSSHGDKPLIIRVGGISRYPPLVDITNPGSSTTIPASSLERMPR